MKTQSQHVKINIGEIVVHGGASFNEAQLVQAIEQAVAHQVAQQGLPATQQIGNVRREVGAIVSAETIAQQITTTAFGGTT